MSASLPLFEFSHPVGAREELAPGARVLRGFALDVAETLLGEIERITAVSPFRYLVTPGGKTMSVAMTNCGQVGWFSDRRGYRYTEVDPETGKPWPVIPVVFRKLARGAAREAGFDD